MDAPPASTPKGKPAIKIADRPVDDRPVDCQAVI
jgi:hypothetical protein